MTITRLEDLAPQHIDVELEHLRTSSGGKVVARCVPVNGFELLKIEGVLPGADPARPANEDGSPHEESVLEATEALASRPTLIDERLYPVVVLGAFLAGPDGELVRPTFSVDPEPGRICLRTVHSHDVMALYHAIKNQSRWQGGPAGEGAFPDDGAVRADSA